MKWGFLIHSLVLLFPDRLYQYEGPSSIPPSVLPFLSSPACSFVFLSHSAFPFPFLLPSSASFLLLLYYSLSASQHLAHTPLAPCNFLLNLIIWLSFSLTTPTLPFTPFIYPTLSSRVAYQQWEKLNSNCSYSGSVKFYWTVSRFLSHVCRLSKGQGSVGQNLVTIFVSLSS